MNSNTIKSNIWLTEWLMLLGLALLWGLSFFTVAIAVKELQPLTIVALRVGFAAVTLWIVIFFSKTKVPRNPEIWFAMLVMGILNNVIPFSLIVWGQQHIPGGLASILNAATPFFTVIVAGIFLADERINRTKILGTITGFAGVVIMIGPAVFTSGKTVLLAQLAILCAALSYAFSGTWGRRFRGYGISMLVVAAGQLTTSSIVMIALALLLEQPLAGSFPSTPVVISIAVLAVFCTALAYLLYFKILASSGAVNLSLVTLLIPVSAVLLGGIFLQEKLGLVHAVGMLLIAIGLSIVDGRLWQRS